MNFLRSLQLSASSSSGYNTNIDTMHNAIGRGNPPAEESLIAQTEQWKPDRKWNVNTEALDNVKYQTHVGFATA